MNKKQNSSFTSLIPTSCDLLRVSSNKRLIVKTQGFTLLEILVALAVFSILATLTSSIMYYAFNTRARVMTQAERLVKLQLAVSMLERDTTQVINRAIHGNEQRLFPVFTGQSDYTEFTRGGFINAQVIEKRSTLKRIALKCTNHQLIRKSWRTLDTTDRTDSREKILLDNIENCHFAYLNKHLQILPEWHENVTQNDQQEEVLPKAIQLSFTIKEWGDASLLFILPQALYD